MKAKLAPDGKSMILFGECWSETLTHDQIPGRLALYRKLRNRGGVGKYAKFYDPTIAALEFGAMMLAKQASNP